MKLIGPSGTEKSLSFAPLRLTHAVFAKLGEKPIFDAIFWAQYGSDFFENFFGGLWTQGEPTDQKSGRSDR